MASIDGHSLHQQAEQARENKDYQTALSLYAQAILAYAAEHSITGMSEVHASLSITYRHLLNQTTDPAEKELWKKEAELSVLASLEIAQIAAQQGDATGLAMAFFNTAKYNQLDNNLEQAVELFKQAVEWMQKAPPKNNNRPAVLWDFKLKLALAELAQGKSDALTQVQEAIAALEADTGVDADYNIKAWVSGAYLQLARHFKETDKNKALEYLAKAKQIVFADDRLIVRQDEYQDLSQQFGC